MKKIFLMLLFTIISLNSFAEKLTINFNTTRGTLKFQKINEKNSMSATFFEKKLDLNLEKGVYLFSFSSPDYLTVDKTVTIDKQDNFLNIKFSKKNSIKIKGNIHFKGVNMGDVKISFTNSKNISYDFISDIYGKFEGIIPYGRYFLKVEKIGYKLSGPINKIYDFYVPEKQINIELSQMPITVSGIVMNEQGNLIPYPEIKIKNESNFMKFVGDKFGKFNIKAYPGIITILAEKDGYIKNGVVRKIENATSLQDIKIKLIKQKYTVSGIVTDGVRALENIDIKLKGEDSKEIASLKTNKYGFFEFYKISARPKIFIEIYKNGKLIEKSKDIILDKNYNNFNFILEK